MKKAGDSKTISTSTGTKKSLPSETVKVPTVMYLVETTHLYPWDRKERRFEEIAGIFSTKEKANACVLDALKQLNADNQDDLREKGLGKHIDRLVKDYSQVFGLPGEGGKKLDDVADKWGFKVSEDFDGLDLGFAIDKDDLFCFEQDHSARGFPENVLQCCAGVRMVRVDEKCEPEFFNS